MKNKKIKAVNNLVHKFYIKMLESNLKRCNNRVEKNIWLSKNLRIKVYIRRSRLEIEI